MRRRHRVPRCAHRALVDRPVEREAVLLHPGIGRTARRVEEHALHGRQRQHVVGAAPLAQKPVDGRLVEPRQRKIGGRVCPAAGARRVRDDRAQHPDVRRGEPLDGPAVMAPRRVAQVRLQCSSPDFDDDLDLVASCRTRTARGPGRLARHAEEPRPLQELVEPTEIVEQDPRRHACLEISPERAVAQQPEADPLPRQRAKQLLGTDQPLAHRRTARARDPHREHRGEPPDRARHVDAEVLATVSLEVHEHRPPAHPLRERPVERRDQHVVDARAVRRRHALQQVGGLALRQTHRHPRHLALDIRAARVLHGHGRSAGRQLRAPVVMFPGRRHRCGLTRHGACPRMPG